MKMDWDPSHRVAKRVISFGGSVLLLQLSLISPAAAACPTATQVCDLYHPGSTATAFCSDEQCFEMNYGEEMRVVAADERGEYPATWFLWTRGSVDSSAYAIPCELTSEGKKKTRVVIPDSESRCAVDIWTPTALYYENFASTPEHQCLGWVECQAGITLPEPTITPVSGKVGANFTINDAQGRIEQGDIVVFYLPGADPTSGFHATDTAVAADGASIKGRVPALPAVEFRVAVVSSDGVVRFDDLLFTVLPI